MSFSIQQRVAGERADAALTDAVNDAIDKSPEHEHDMIRSVGNTAHELLTGLGDVKNEDHQVEIVASGSMGDNMKSIALNVSATRLRNFPNTKAKTERIPWAPPKGPLAATRAEREAKSSTAPTPASGSSG